MAWLRRLSAVLLAAVLLAPAPAQAAQDNARLDKTVRYLQNVQNKDGGFGEKGSSPSFSFWAAMAFASAGINPRDQRKKPDGTDLYTYLTRHTGGLEQSTDFARVILVARAAGTSPRKFGKIDAVARLRRLQRPDGGFRQDGPESQVNGTTYAILALAKLERTRVRRATDWLLSRQAPDGSFGSLSANTDETGAAIEALNAAGRRGTPQQQKALAYLRSRQNPDGGFSEADPGDISNTSSTAWVVRGLVAAGIQPTGFRAPSGRTPLQYLAAMQRPDGSVPTSTRNPHNLAFSTAFTTPALAGVSFPLPEVQREEQPRTEQREAPPPPTDQGDDGGQPGAGGNAPGSGGGVTSGGGGGGAPLFSQPQPGSRGQAPGATPDTQRPNPSTAPGAGQVQGESVVGKLVGQGSKLATGKSRRLGSAPGLRAAAAGGDAPSGLVAGIGVALVLGALGGVYLERRGGDT